MVIGPSVAGHQSKRDHPQRIDRSHYLMTQALLPSVAAGGDVGAQFPNTAYTLRRFTHNYLLSLHNSITWPEEKLVLDVMGRSLAYIALLGGCRRFPSWTISWIGGRSFSGPLYGQT